MPAKALQANKKGRGKPAPEPGEMNSVFLVQNGADRRNVLLLEADPIGIGLKELDQIGAGACGFQGAHVVFLAAERRLIYTAAGLAAFDKARLPDRTFLQHAVEQNMDGAVHPALILGQGQNFTAGKRPSFLPKDIHDFDFVFCQIHESDFLSG